jgi:hypothetical protein
MYIATPSGIEDLAFAQAILTGLASTGMLCARTITALNLVTDVATRLDWRDPLSSAFRAEIRAGNIRCDARWSHGGDAPLVDLAKLCADAEETMASETANHSQTGQILTAMSSAMSAGRAIQDDFAF